MALSSQQLTQIQTHGLRWVDENDLGLTRAGGAGPTDHKAFSFASQTSMIPVFNEQIQR
jgi:hypothetical protein